MLEQKSMIAKKLAPDLIRLFVVMAGLVPAIHVFTTRKAWMPATSAGMTMRHGLGRPHLIFNFDSGSACRNFA